MSTSSSEKNKGASFNHILKYTGIFSIVQVLNILMNIIRNKIAAIFLGPSGLGVLSLYNTASNLLNQTTNFGIPMSGVKHISEIHESGDSDRLRDYACTVRSFSVLSGLFGVLSGFSVILFCYLHPGTGILPHINDFWNKLVLLAVVFLMSVTGGEMAILKGTKQLKSVTKVSLLMAFFTLLVCSPIFYLMGRTGIVWALLLSNISYLWVHLHYSTRVLPYKINIRSRSNLRRGIPMIKLGIGFIIAGLFGQGAEYVIRMLILNGGSEADVGLYNSGYVMVVTYAAVIFTALEADYFPRLSATGNDVDRQNMTVNRQIEVCVLLITPFLIFFVFAMPFLIPLFYSDKFVECIPMSIGAMLYMFFRAFSLPIGYLALARGDSMMYMFTELVYDLVVMALIPYSYFQWGLLGTGLMLSLCGLFDFLMIYFIYRWRYSYHFSCQRLWIYAIQFILLSSSVYAGLRFTGWLRISTIILLLFISGTLSVYILSKETNFFIKLKQKIHKRDE